MKNEQDWLELLAVHFDTDKSEITIHKHGNKSIHTEIYCSASKRSVRLFAEVMDLRIISYNDGKSGCGDPNCDCSYFIEFELGE